MLMSSNRMILNKYTDSEQCFNSLCNFINRLDRIPRIAFNRIIERFAVGRLCREKPTRSA